jgi:RecA/RadA recombinase
VPIAPRLVAELNAHLPGAVRRGDAALDPGGRERLATGFAALDAALGGGLPRGHLSEIVGPASTGLTSLVQRLLGHVTGQAHVAAWIDAPDAFDPASAVAAGVDLERLLWVRPPDLATAFVATESVLALGGFPLVLLDASPPARKPSSSPRAPGAGARRWPDRDRRMADALHVWLRLARAAARSRSVLVVLQRTGRRVLMPGDAAGTSATAGVSAAVRLELEPLRVVWDRAGGAPSLLDGLVAQVVVSRNRGGRGSPSRVVLELA